MKRFLWLGFVLSVYLICSGCGDTFRPIIIPNPPIFPNPAGAHTVMSINNNGSVVPGTAMVIDVSGDSVVSIANVGLAPVHSVQQSASEILVANHSAIGTVADSITGLNFSGTTISSTTTISLPPNSAPSYVAVAPSATTAYVTLPGLVPDPSFPGNNAVGVVNTLSSSLTTTVEVGNQPDAIGVTPDNTKFYVANYGDSTLDGFNTADLSPRTINGSFNAPVWVIARNDSQRLYVLNGTTGSPQQDGVVSTIDTTSTAGPDPVIDASVSVPGATFMLYDGNLNRLYIPWFNQSTMLGQLTILDVSQSVPAVLAGGPISACAPMQAISCIPTVPPSTRAGTDPCLSTTEATPLMVVAVTSLPNGTRAYVGAYYEDSNNNICPQVTAIDAASITVTDSTPIPGFPDATIEFLPGGGPDPYYVAACVAPTPPAPYHATFRFMMASGGDSSRAYLASCDAGNVNIVDTSSDTYILNQPAPIGTRAPISPGQLNPPQNPVFLIGGP